jgi:hypothetical protein
MLTITINDSQLEEKLANVANKKHLSVEETAKEILHDSLVDDKLLSPFKYTIRDPDLYGVPINFGIPDDEIIDAKPFSDVEDAGEYIRKLRAEAWKRI